MSDERSIEQVEHFIYACGNASRRYYDMGDDGAKRMAEAYAWMGRGAVWAIRIMLDQADAETAFNDPIRTMVKGFSDEDSNEMVEMLADIWNHKEEDE